MQFITIEYMAKIAGPQFCKQVRLYSIDVNELINMDDINQAANHLCS